MVLQFHLMVLENRILFIWPSDFLIYSILDIEGGELVLTDLNTEKSTVIEPRTNRIVVFSGGEENLIEWNPVTKVSFEH